MLCGAGNVGALVLLCPLEASSKNYWFISIELKFRVHFIPASPWWYHSLTRGWCPLWATYGWVEITRSIGCWSISFQQIS
jgi:hypothetical protein